MTNPPRNSRPHTETALEEGLRRYAPKDGEGRRVAVSDFLISLLGIYARPGGDPRN
jgi:hypothetical protein